MLAWISEFLDLIISFFPKMVKIRATHRGVKWPRCGDPVEMRNGLNWLWPIVTDYEVVVTARQTDPLPPQSLTLSDGTPVAVCGMTIYEIDDVVAAYGQRNWDVTSTVKDLSMAAIAQVVTKLKKDDLRDLSLINRRVTRRVRAWAEKYGVRIEQCQLVEVSVARTIRHLGVNDSCVGPA